MNPIWREHRERIERYLAEGRTVSGGDRAAQAAAKKAETEAVNTAGTERGNANAEHAALTPFYRQEMNAQHLFTPGQTNTLLDAAGAPLASSAATAAGQATSQGAHTRNTSGFSAALDQNARDRQAAMGQVGENVASQDIMGAKKLNQEGAAGMAGLFGTDTSGMLSAMGQEHEDINSQLEAGKSGWYQNLLSGINTLKPGVNFNHNF
jgi:hypothetical protein